MSRKPEEIRASIEANRAQFSTALDHLRSEVTELTNWRAKVQRHKPQVIAGAAVAGLVIGRALFRRR